MKHDPKGFRAGGSINELWTPWMRVRETWEKRARPDVHDASVNEQFRSLERRTLPDLYDTMRTHDRAAPELLRQTQDAQRALENLRQRIEAVLRH
jgi:hypothetical protein